MKAIAIDLIKTAIIYKLKGMMLGALADKIFL